MKNSNNIILYIITALYLGVHFVPDFGGIDVIGAQWLYSSSVDILVLAYFMFNQNQYSEAIKFVFSQKFTLLYTFYFIWALISISYAINPTEAIVCLARLATTFFIYTNFAILLYKKEIKNYFLPLSVLISLVLFYDSVSVIASFFKNSKTMLLDENISSLTGKNGNKNVMAASLLIKFPFALFVILRSKLLGRLIGIFVLFFGSFALFILNARSTLVGLFLILVIFTVSTLYFKTKSAWPKIVWPLAYFIIPISIAFFSANLVLENTVKSQEVQGGYGTVTKRIYDITANAKEESRLRLWNAGLDYFTKHPFIGDGYGNWKLVSIPYEKEYTNDLFVPYHAHNDFIEVAADLGIVGGLAYLGLFIIAFLFTVKIWLNEDAQNYRLFATISFMALTCYFVDAFLNFPTERTTMQTMLMLTFGLLFSLEYLIVDVDKKINTLKMIIPLYVFLGIGLVGGSLYINNQVLKSLKVQKYVMDEIEADPKLELSEVKNAFPAYPNISISTIPIKALIARYELRDKNYDVALKLLKESDRDNPYLFYNDFIRSAIYDGKKDLDSVAYFSYNAFYHLPRSSSYFKNAIYAAAQNRDTLELHKIFNVYNQYRTGGLAYSQYILGLYQVKGSLDQRMLGLLEFAYKKFPEDSVLILNTKKTILGNVGAIKANQNAANGAKAFHKGRYLAAANFYIQASILEPVNYTHFVNIGLCYYSNKNYRNCIQYFDKANTFSQNTTGKSYFFKALSLLALGKKEEACQAFNAAKDRSYAEADAFIQLNCRGK